MMEGKGEQGIDIAEGVLGEGELGGMKELEQAVQALWQSWSCIIENIIMWKAEGREWLNICWWVVARIGSSKDGDLKTKQEVFYR
jgi:hypothetical protein